MHRFQTHKDKEATKAKKYLSRYSYVSTRIHPCSDPPHQCEYLAGADCGIRRAEIFERDGWRCQVAGCLGMPLELSHGGRTKVSRCWCYENLTTLCRFHHMRRDGNRVPRFSEAKCS